MLSAHKYSYIWSGGSERLHTSNQNVCDHEAGHLGESGGILSQEKMFKVKLGVSRRLFHY